MVFRNGLRVHLFVHSSTALIRLGRELGLSEKGSRGVVPRHDEFYELENLRLGELLVVQELVELSLCADAVALVGLERGDVDGDRVRGVGVRLGARGEEGQQLLVVPASDLVVLRLGPVDLTLNLVSVTARGDVSRLKEKKCASCDGLLVEYE